MSSSLWPHGLQLARLPCPSPTPGACSNSYPSSWWCHPTISSSVIPFSCFQSFPESGSFLMSQLFSSGGQSIIISASATVLPVNIQDWFPVGWTGWIALQSRGFSRTAPAMLKIKMRCKSCKIDRMPILSMDRVSTPKSEIIQGYMNGCNFFKPGFSQVLWAGMITSFPLMKESRFPFLRGFLWSRWLAGLSLSSSRSAFAFSSFLDVRLVVRWGLSTGKEIHFVL